MPQLSPVLQQATPVVATRGEGMYLYDADDRRYLDFTAGVGVTNTGHCHPRVVEAVRQQAGQLIHGQYTTVMHDRLLTLTERLGEVLPAGLDALFYLNSGSEAVEAALRLARHATGRQNVIVLDGSFHGRTMGAAAMSTAGTRFRAGSGPLMPGVAVAPFPHAFALGLSEEAAVAHALRGLDHVLATVSAPEETAAIFVEPVLGEGGYVPAPPGYLAGLRERADRHGILLVLDEIQTGFGRTGRFWAHEHSAGVVPDILITAKGLASGFPLSAIAASVELMGRARPGSQGGTYGGNAVACAAALATLDVIRDEGLVANAAEQGRRLADGLRKTAAGVPAVADVRGTGLMLASEFRGPDGSPDAALARAVQQAAAERGLLLLTCGVHGNVVRMIPALVVTAEQIDEALTLWSDAVAAAVR
ncbi:aminotransferase class III-fold pyridoxal phosphate-dependent enzyme [Streptomyces spectabilis]|uniref:(S)-3-amino-2-methylpropionate transaminase n=1 Tax=Streptomyces spectabilis TaxID=68270 RepID=A0A5P2XM19_STRST|nr:aminotransferase class III-fold pyridoxal phosphate-dependent enzyme [Streptomyces spectabilis]MBB5105478.1 4-aminobutyrate aminotransferase [Streptomyces spectabilis]MCI3906665.1 aminotransferase class III-fold pyridoxal phosphate-dependent enzyme [Streptomyces spectabilis]QEV63482.1 aminotransferase class III-fold pyridoxal phosphate-dependent enzyme [Streptomyces spectabilis]GGV21903.1 aspartate aminotransferase family protein [Streptomyces spectabilis]